MRGSRNLYLNYQDKNSKTHKRNIDRDKALTARYYYYMNIKKLNYVTILANLEREFHISEERIIDVLTYNRGRIDEYMVRKPNCKMLMGEFPWFNWAV